MKIEQPYLLYYSDLVLLPIFYVDLILSITYIHHSVISQMLWFFIIKCWILWVLWLYICLIFSGITFWEKFANVLLIPLLMDSCENRSLFYWVLWPQSYSFFANVANILLFFCFWEDYQMSRFITIMSKCSKSNFCKNAIFRKCFCDYYCISMSKSE